MACTSALVSGSMTRDGNPLMWKHRDTGSPHNFIAHHQARHGSYEFIALHNSSDSTLSEAWIGMNRPGLAVMNTALYNLAPDTARVKDLEGFVMARALASCRTVGDFATLLDTLPRPMGVQACFGVMDATGDAAFFETNDHGYKRYSFPAGTHHATVRTNYGHSGGTENRLGEAREKNAQYLLRGNTALSHETFIDTLSRSLYDSTIGRDRATGPDTLLWDNGDMIPRCISTASIVIEARPSANGDGSNYVMWTSLGYPPCSYTVPVTFDNIPHDILPDPITGITPMEQRADELKAPIFTERRKGRYRYFSLPAYLRAVAQAQNKQ